ncbi:hypothetical protein DF164_29755 [Burkholderia stagnalis]|nr:hypothetical protein DF164_29755 [Burkholderia stagnalis]
MRRAVILLRTGCADLIEAAGVLRRSPIWQAGYMHADRFDITNKKLAKGVGSIHARKGRLPRRACASRSRPRQAERIYQRPFCKWKQSRPKSDISTVRWPEART